MRFIRQEHITTTICDKKLSDIEIIKTLLENLMKSRLDFSLTIKKHFQSDYGYRTVNYEKARIKKVNETTIDFLIFTQSATTKIKNINFTDVVEIFAITKKSEILKKHPDISRFGLMDI